MKDFPNYFVLRASKRGVWSATPFVNEAPARRSFEGEKLLKGTATAALLEIRVNPDEESRVMYAMLERFSNG